MRLKQLLSSVGMLLILSTVAFAANTQSAAAPAIAASQSAAANKSAAHGAHKREAGSYTDQLFGCDSCAGRGQERIRRSG